VNHSKQVGQLNDNTNLVVLLRRYWLTLAVSLGVLMLSFGGESLRELLRYERVAILDGHEYWRLLSGHLVHGSWQHTWLNVAGLLLLSALFHATYQPWQWAQIVLIAALSVDAGLIYLMPQLTWYVGLSGILHGVLAAGAVAWWCVETKPMAATLTMILIGKLMWEQWQGALPISGELAVIVNAHLYGAIGGALMGTLLVRRLPRNTQPTS
jgi:rhomboid family GlyGly-CTERM serine protease